jgi:hypothetical protein
MPFDTTLGKHFVSAALIPCVLFALAARSPTVEQSSERSSVPYDSEAEGGGPTFHNLTLSYRYSGVYRSIHEVDFRDFTLHIFDAKKAPGLIFKLRNGRVEVKGRGEFDSVTLSSVYYMTSSGNSRPEYALVLYDWFTAAGSSDMTGIAQVFEIHDQRLILTQQIDWDEHFDADGPYDSFDRITNNLVLRTAHYLPGDAHCCVSAMDIVTLHWNEFKLLQRSIYTELTKYGRREGKQLTR